MNEETAVNVNMLALELTKLYFSEIPRGECYKNNPELKGKNIGDVFSHFTGICRKEHYLSVGYQAE